MNGEMSVPEVAALLGVSRQTVWRWVQSGRIPSRRIGLQYVISRVNAERMAQYRALVFRMAKSPFARRRRTPGK